MCKQLQNILGFSKAVKYDKIYNYLRGFFVPIFPSNLPNDGGFNTLSGSGEAEFLTRLINGIIFSSYKV